MQMESLGGKLSLYDKGKRVLIGARHNRVLFMSKMSGAVTDACASV